MAPDNIEIVRQVLQGLEQVVVPALTDPVARVYVDLFSRLLNHVVVQEEGASLKQARLEQQSNVDIGEQIIDLFSFRVCDLSGQALAERAARVAAAVQAERLRLLPLQPEIAFGIGSTYEGGRLDRKKIRYSPPEHGEDNPLTISTITEILRANGDTFRHAVVEDLRILPGGFSKQTLLIKGQNLPWGDGEFVIRRDGVSNYTNTSVIDEAPVLTAMFEAGIRVAEPLHLEKAGPRSGPAFLISRKCPGTNSIAAWRNDSLKVERFLSDLAAQIAALHRIPAAHSGMPPGDIGRPLEELITAEIKRWAVLYQGLGAEPYWLEAERSWLLANIPHSGGRPTVIHGDIGFHNLLTEDGAITAILDWEFCHLGDPQEELNYVRPFVEMVGAWDRFIGHYESTSGLRYRPQDALFWEIWRNYRNGAGCAGALHAFRQRNFRNAIDGSALAASAFAFGPRYQLEAAERIVDALSARHSAFSPKKPILEHGA